MSTLSMELAPQVGLTDEVLAQKIRSHLSSRSNTVYRQLSVAVNDRVATLRGKAGSYYQRQLWLHEVKSFGELDGIVDQIEVA
ncbi:hypothetical protein ETAA8_48890 [Anatilimnocola aggregata]|uniref:Uncharacterized protein n=1 Tax=Anatilimnocola aggregata TaxID=2528021 RepID=A0A517YHU2_9BACT|nr:BON domain-containing protein [Anatilimnocola aggregata]QDU29774.1 hypothetical protein ETAA8_48890 [Anatilimnocola aggregata]